MFPSQRSHAEAVCRASFFPVVYSWHLVSFVLHLYIRTYIFTFYELLFCVTLNGCSVIKVTYYICPGGDGGERGVVPWHGLRANPKEDLEPDGEAVLLSHCQADGGRLIHLCAGLAGCHDAQHCRGDAVQGVCTTCQWAGYIRRHKNILSSKLIW